MTMLLKVNIVLEQPSMSQRIIIKSNELLIVKNHPFIVRIRCRVDANVFFYLPTGLTEMRIPELLVSWKIVNG